METHEYNCSECGAVFDTEDAFMEHLPDCMAVPDGGRYKCVACGAGFSQREQLRRHIIDCHLEPEE